MTTLFNKVYICNAFSLSMLDPEAQRASAKDGTLNAKQDKLLLPRIPRPIDDPKLFLEQMGLNDDTLTIESAVGHADTAVLIGKELGLNVAMNRTTVKLGSACGFKGQSEYALVAQYNGPRLPEGTTELPPGASFNWWLV
jgi:hypothetical protein